MSTRPRLVYSTSAGRMCPACGWPADNCQCSAKRESEAPVPGRSGAIVAKLRMEKKGRAGKSVTVVSGLPQNEAFLKGLCQELKRACGAGGTVVDGGVELQGDLRERVRELLLKKDFTVKG